MKQDANIEYLELFANDESHDQIIIKDNTSALTTDAATVHAVAVANAVVNNDNDSNLRFYLCKTMKLAGFR